MLAFWDDNKALTATKSVECPILQKDWDTLIEQSVLVEQSLRH